jgi:hypothetical protein
MRGCSLLSRSGRRALVSSNVLWKLVLRVGMHCSLKGVGSDALKAVPALLT